MAQRPVRTLTALLCAQLLAACSATAQPPHQGLWPQPRPQDAPFPVVRAAPDFHAPSATHCARPVHTRELPGRPPGQQHEHWGSAESRDRIARSGPAEAGSFAKSGPAAGAGLPPPSAPAATPRAEAGELADSAARHESLGHAAPQRHAPFAPPQQQPAPSPVVTAGVVDDNADFTSYLAFRNRTRVEHRARDIRERYLLEVKDSRGRSVADAEVAVQADSGHATWARTDAAGRVWLHPNAFDPARSHGYQVAVRKDGHESYGRLTRGQKSAVEVTLDGAFAPARAKLDLVFLIDATGSMADEIDKLRATLRTITAEVARLPSRPDLCLGLVAYRDRGDEFLLRSHDFTDDVGGFLRDALYPLRAGGGGDYPEAMNEALHETVHRLSWRGDGTTRLVVLLADAPPHLDYGAPHYDEGMMASLGKGIKLFSVGASGLNRQGEFIQRQMAQYTGGRFVFLTYAQAHRPSSGPGRETVHDVKNYSVDTLDRLIVRLVSEELGKLALAH